MSSTGYRTAAGRRWPLGATVEAGGVNFCIFSRCATAVTLLLYGGADEPVPLQRIELDPRVHRTFFFWHVLVVGARPGLYYTWCMDGPNDPSQGLRFDPRQELLDPWARIVSDANWDRARQRTGKPAAMRGAVAPVDDYDWEGDAPLARPLEDAIIYELHVRGFTQHESSDVEHRGTYRGIVDKIPYLTALGITDIELLPVFAFDRQDVPAGAAARGLDNFWGYSPYGFFAPHAHFAAGDDARTEFRDMVKALHRAGIGIILDVVLNHTSEGGRDGVTISFKGWGNEFFYHLEPDDPENYRDFTGCGNAINCNHPFVAHFLLQCLEFWVTEMHVDGFRFDLASVLSRGEDGEPDAHAPVLWSIEFSQALARSHLIAEAWDASGLHQLGDFPGIRWSEWNGRYRDAIRRFTRGDPGLRAEVATCLAGSADLFGADGGHPVNGINFVTCHDGFTLNDLVSYAVKHNEANGEDNRDGADENFSDNCGMEGPSEDPRVSGRRLRRARNFMAMLLLSQGVPMVLAGDERLRTQRGNNNAYCQDNELAWLDWTETTAAVDMQRFTTELIALRKRHASLRRRRFIAPPGEDGRCELLWYDADGHTPDWQAADARVLCFSLAPVAAAEAELFAILNMSDAPVDVTLPARDTGGWQRLVDTSLAPPDDIVVPARGIAVERTYRAGADCVVVLESR